MDTDDSSSRDHIPPPLRFDSALRKKLQAKFAKNFRETHPNYCLQQDEYEAKVFVGTLESYAAGIPEFQRISPPEQKRRREKVRALAVAMENLHKAIDGVDSAALDFAVRRGLREVETDGFAVPAIYSVFGMRDVMLKVLAAFSRGVRLASKELPSHGFNLKLRTALAVERTFFESRTPFTVSESGFAAECLRAVFQLGGLEEGRVDYWLILARDSDESMRALSKRLTECQKTADN